MSIYFFVRNLESGIDHLGHGTGYRNVVTVNTLERGLTSTNVSHFFFLNLIIYEKKNVYFFVDSSRARIYNMFRLDEVTKYSLAMLEELVGHG
jgi:hypothetical protein